MRSHWPRLLAVAGPAAVVVGGTLIFYPSPPGIWLQGLVIGLLDAMLAVAMGLVYRSNRVINFAQADLGMVPTVLAFGLIGLSGVNYFLGLGTGVAAAMLLGGIVEFAVVRRFVKAPRLLLTVATIGVSQVLIVGSLLIPEIWGTSIMSQVSVHFPTSWSFNLDPLVFTADHVVAAAVSVVALAAVAYWLRVSDVGVGVRAAADRPERAAALGIPVKRLQTGVWVVSAVLSFLAIFLQSAITGLPISDTASLSQLLVALAALCLGGFVDLPAMALSAVALGVLNQAVLWNVQTNTIVVDAVMAVAVLGGILVQRARRLRGDGRAGGTWPAVVEYHPLPSSVRKLPSVLAASLAGAAALLAFAATVPIWLGPSSELEASTVLAVALVALSVIVLTGWSGQVTLGQMSFAALGAAVGAVAATSWGLDLSLALVVAGGCGAVAAVVVALPAIRLGGMYTAVTTLVFALAASGYLLDRAEFSWIPEQQFSRPALFGVFRLGSQSAMYEATLVIVTLAFAAVSAIRRSRTGRALRATRSNEQAAQAYGVRTLASKLTAFAISGFLAGTAGCLLVTINQQYTESPFIPTESLAVFTAAVVGGLGSASGAVIGALIVYGATLILPPSWQLLPSAGGVLIVLVVLPGGLGELLARLRDAAARSLAGRRAVPPADSGDSLGLPAEAAS